MTTPSSPRLSDLEQTDEFLHRHIGPNADETAEMLKTLGHKSLEALIDQTLPASIRLPKDLPLPGPQTEHNALAALKTMAQKNRVNHSLIGMGYADTLTPKVILRNVLENPGWYTAYTPYQAEISQGRLEALLNFQQMVIDMTGLEIANASLLDEATAAAEAMSMARRVSKHDSTHFFVDENVFPQTLDVLKTRASYFGFDLIIGDPLRAPESNVFGALFQYPNDRGEVSDLTPLITRLKAQGVVTALACDLMALALIKSPGEMGADIALGSSQRFGIPLGFGGPHAAFFATRIAHARAMPGRIIGVSKDSRDKPAFRMSLQTREQHIRREKANSNICTSQVLLANMAGLYAVYHGPEGLKTIARRIHRLASLLAYGLAETGAKVSEKPFFDTFWVDFGKEATRLYAAALAAGYNLRRINEHTLGIAINEKTSRKDVARLIEILSGQEMLKVDIDLLDTRTPPRLPDTLHRQTAFLTHPVFNQHHTEHAMLRYLKRLQNRDLALDHSMISLGSCTMKLNATSEMIPVTWSEFSDIHPFAPLDQAKGYREMMLDLENSLKTLTGFDAICLQPNSGAQGEYAGLVAIRRYQQSQHQEHRNICLIPKSAHGTNPATAQMCGLTVVVVDCDESGNIDLSDLKAKATQHAESLSCLMVTYPSTHGVFEAGIREICDIIHAHGGQVYMDGANLNAQVGLTSPGFIGADVSHMNLHKTFAIPHGGGGPGMGPIGLKAHLAPFMPNHAVQTIEGAHHGQGAVSAAPWGSASILPISWMYIALLGGIGLKKATSYAILNANYLAARLAPHYPVLYTGETGHVAHECILDVRPLKAATDITETDIAKRLMDYGFHAPTISFPVPGTLMIEPTESESRSELDRFIEAMISIREEIRGVETGRWPAKNNPLKNAPHTQADILEADWNRPYSRTEAVHPLPWVSENKFWPSVNRIDDVFGDRNLVCHLP